VSIVGEPKRFRASSTTCGPTRLIRDVVTNENNACTDPPRCFFAFCSLDIGHDDFAAFGGEQPCLDFTHAAGGAGYNSNLIRKTAHVICSKSFRRDPPSHSAVLRGAAIAEAD
jgi:hypothetical protein